MPAQFLPTVLIESENMAFVFDAGHPGLVAVLGGKDLAADVPWQFLRLCVLRSIVPHHRHHHVLCK